MSQWGQQQGQWSQRPQHWGDARSQWGQPSQQWNQPQQPSWQQPRAPQQGSWGQPSQPWGQAPSWQPQSPRQQTTPWQPAPSQQRPPARRSNPLATAMKWLGIALLVMFLSTIYFGMTSEVDQPKNDRSSGQYENEDYQVPPVDRNPPDLPVPRTERQATEWLQANPLYNVDLANPVRCDMTAVNLRSASTAQLEQHLNEYMACLMRVWGPALESANMIPVRPSVTVYNRSVKTPCGDLPMMNAVYCGANQQVYYATDLPRIIPAQLQNVPYVVESVMAHEFAHAVQGRSGILISRIYWQQQGDKATQNDLSRRTEVQADCFSGMFNASVGESLGIDENNQQQLAQLFYSIGDDQGPRPVYDGGHGSAKLREKWYLTGAANRNIGQCNTFVGPASEYR